MSAPSARQGELSEGGHLSWCVEAGSASCETRHVYLTPAIAVLAKLVTDFNGNCAISGTIPAKPLSCGTRRVAQGIVPASSGAEICGQQRLAPHPG